MKNCGQDMQPPHIKVMTIRTESEEWEIIRSTNLTLAFRKV